MLSLVDRGVVYFDKVQSVDLIAAFLKSECTEIGEADAELGNLDAAYRLWRHGCKDSFGWLRAAAQSGHSLAQNDLGVAFQNGEIVTRDYVEAIKWFGMSAEQGCVYGQLNLAQTYANGTGVKKDPKNAYKWLLLAYSHGGRAWGMNEIEKTLSAEDIGEAQAWAKSTKANRLDDRCGKQT